MKFFSLILLCIFTQSSHASLICADQAIPDNYVIIRRSIPSSDCSTWRKSATEWVQYTKMEVVPITDSIVEITICDDQMTPKGFSVICKQTSAYCGNFQSGIGMFTPYSALVIKRN